MVSIKFNSLKKPNQFFGILIGISILGFLVRLFGLNWDNGLLFHPDERQLLMLSHQISWNDLNPRWFNYGSLPLYLLEIITTGLDLTVYELRIPGRILSALFDSISIYLIGIIGEKFHSKTTGIFSSIFYATCAIAIQNSHFFVVDTFLVTIILGIIITCSYITTRISYGKICLLGFLFASAMATKISSLPIIFVIFLSLFIYYRTQLKKGTFNKSQVLKIIILFFSSSIITYALFNPFSLLDFKDFLNASLTQSKMARGALDFPYTRQYFETTPYLYHASQIIKVSLGPILGILSFLGVIFVCTKLDKNIPNIWILLLFWLLIYFSFFGAIHTKFIRYMFPIIPVLIVFASYLISFVYENYFHKYKIYKFIIIGIIIMASFHYTLSFINIYTSDHPAKTAAEFIDSNFKENSIILKEHWDEALPLSNNYQISELNMYDPDSVEKIRIISKSLSEADGIYITSKRLFATIPRLKERYPLSSNYYKKLFSEELGFDLIKAEIQSPTSFGISYYSDPFQRIPSIKYSSKSDNEFSIDLGWTDESFSVYDHPVTFIFINSKRIDQETIFSEIINIDHNESYSYLISDEQAKDLYGPPYKGIFYEANSFTSFLIWYLVLQLISIAFIPLIWILLRNTNFPIASSIKILSVLVFSFLFWILISLKLIDFTFLNGVLLFAGTVTLSSIIFYVNKSDLVAFLKINRSSFLKYEIIFFISLLIFTMIRAANPDLWHPFRGGEKPMEIAYINAILNSKHMPPLDPWFSSGLLNYYYFGFFIYSSLIKLTQINPFIGFNISIATLFAFSITTLFGFAANLSKKKIILPAIMICTTLIFGNFQPFLQIIRKIKLLQFSEIFNINYWEPSRVIGPDSKGFEISEFPSFSFIFADLHPHVIAIPIMILGISFLILTFSKKNKEKVNSKSFIFPTILINSFLLGILWVTNTWNVPLQAFLIFIFSYTFVINIVGKIGALKYSIGYTLVCIVIAYVLFLPFHNSFVSPFSGFELNEFKTNIGDFLEIHFLSIFIIIIFFITTKRSILQQKMKESLYFKQMILILISGLLIALSVELFKAKNDIGRMNTFFKFYIQIWILLSISSSYLLVEILQKFKRKWLRPIFLLVISSFAFIGLLFPVFGTMNRINDRFTNTNFSLNGALYGSTAEYNTLKGTIKLKSDFEAFTWMRENIENSSIIAEGIAPLYTWGGRFSIYTGFPTVIGWDWHQVQQRQYNRSLINERQNDINEFYTSTDINRKLEIINKYSIELIIIGSLERIYYPEEGIRSLKSLEEEKLMDKIYSNEETTIYRMVKK